ncbi:MAG: SLC13 family permease [Planctomycetota bacterium]
MTWEQIYVLALAAITIALLALEKAHLSVLGVGLVVAVAIPGVVAAEEAIAGLANPALVTIAALFVVGEGFLRTGAASILADNILQRTGRSESLVVVLMMVMAAALSAFVNNTLVIVTFLPVVTTICRETGFYPSRMLIPLSYASILGGLCTLVGTSTNLLVAGAMEKANVDWHLTMFSMTPPGIVMAGAGILYLALFGRRLLPRIHSLSTQMAAGSVKEYVMEITVADSSQLIGERAGEIGKNRGQKNARTTAVVRGETLLWPPFDEVLIQKGDVVMLSGPIPELTQLQRDEMRSDGQADSYDPASMSFFELALSPTSTWVGRRVGDVALKSDFGAVVVAVQRSGRHIRDRVSTMTLLGGDVLLAFGDERSKHYLRMTNDFHVIEGVQDSIHRNEKAPWAFGIVLGVIALLVTEVVHYSTAALTGALAMTVSRCLTVRQAHQAIRWPIILFIAGMIALSAALMESGTTELIADTLTRFVPDEGGDWLLLCGTFLATVVMTEFLTNNAVAVLMTPLAITTAQKLDLSEIPFVMAVALGASCCFANPMGYQTNLMVLGPGGYRFRHFIKVGLPLDLLLFAVGVAVIPLFWPLR